MYIVLTKNHSVESTYTVDDMLYNNIRIKPFGFIERKRLVSNPHISIF